MKKYNDNTVSLPNSSEGWEKMEFGMSMFESRIISYLTIIFCLFINVGGALILGDSFFIQIEVIKDYFGKIGVILSIVFSALTYHIIHEFIHVLYFPEKWRSDRALFGFLHGSALFVIYNGEISKRQMERCYMGPFYTILPFLALIVMLFPGIITLNLLFLHLLTCAGDIVFRYKFRRLVGVTHVWFTINTFWVKY